MFYSSCRILHQSGIEGQAIEGHDQGQGQAGAQGQVQSQAQGHAQGQVQGQAQGQANGGVGEEGHQGGRNVDAGEPSRVSGERRVAPGTVGGERWCQAFTAEDTEEDYRL